MSNTRLAPRPESPSVVAHDIRDVGTALANALQVVRLVAGDDTRVTQALRLAERQVPALARLADRLEGPAAIARLARSAPDPTVN